MQSQYLRTTAEFEQRIESLSNELTASRTTASERKSELKNLTRENTNLATINAGLSARVDKTLASMSKLEGQVSGLIVMLDAEKEKLMAVQSTMATRLDDKDLLIASLEKQVVAQPVVAKKKTRRKSR